MNPCQDCQGEDCPCCEHYHDSYRSLQDMDPDELAEYDNYLDPCWDDDEEGIDFEEGCAEETEDHIDFGYPGSDEERFEHDDGMG